MLSFVSVYVLFESVNCSTYKWYNATLRLLSMLELVVATYCCAVVRMWVSGHCLNGEGKPPLMVELLMWTLFCMYMYVDESVAVLECSSWSRRIRFVQSSNVIVHRLQYAWSDKTTALLQSGGQWHWVLSQLSVSGFCCPLTGLGHIVFVQTLVNSSIQKKRKIEGSDSPDFDLVVTLKG